MKTDPRDSIYQEDKNALKEFSSKEARRLRIILRRLRFLEAQAKSNKDTNGSAPLFIGWEIEALEWILDEVGFLLPRTEN